MRVIVCLLIMIAALLVTASPRFELKSNRYYPLYNLQADAFLNGRADLTLPNDWSHDVIAKDGKKYFALPPLNGILLMPFVALWGVSFPERWFTLMLFAAYLVLISWFVSKHVRKYSKWDDSLWMIFFGLGTGLLVCTAAGTVWFSAALSSSLLLSLAAAIAWQARTTKHNVFAISLLCLAALGRYQLILIAPFFILAAYWRDSSRNFKKLVVLSTPVLVFMALIGFWNWWRWDELFNLRYREHGYGAYFQEVISRYGFTSPRYVFLHLYHGLFAVPPAKLEFPFFSFDPAGNGLFATSPLFLFMIFRKHRYSKEDWMALGCIAVVALVIVTHFSTGWRQFGYRYSLDVFPFLAFLLTRANFRIASPLGVTLVLVSVWYNVIGALLSVQ